MAKPASPLSLMSTRKHPHGKLLYAQSGGVTAVINATASAVISEARAHHLEVLAARNGILGVLNDDLIDTSTLSAADVRALLGWPLDKDAVLAQASPVRDQWQGKQNKQQPDL